MIRSRATAVLAGALLLGACAHLPVDSDGLSLGERRERLASLTGWALRGRLSVNTADGGFQGSFEWRSNGDIIALIVRGPFGAGVLDVSGTADRLTVRARGDTWLLGDPETELSGLLGWWMPVTSLQSWLVGLPDPAYAARSEPGPSRTLSVLEQRYWRLEYPSYQLSNGLLLPRRIDLNHGDIALRLTIDRFEPQHGIAGLN